MDNIYVYVKLIEIFQKSVFSKIFYSFLKGTSFFELFSSKFVVNRPKSVFKAVW
jgi:hypothetical protein